MIPEAHALTGQNLARHLRLEQRLRERGILLVSDSAPFKTLFRLLFYKKPIAVHALELYSISFLAWASEFSYRLRGARGEFFRNWRIIPGFCKQLFKVLFLKKIIGSKNIVLISSNLRKEFLIKRGIGYKVLVVKNKPIINNYITMQVKCRRNVIALVGNLNNGEDFLRAHKFAIENNLEIHCFGLQDADFAWLQSAKLVGVVLKEKLDGAGVAEVLSSCKYSLCLYSDKSVNQRYSASSKLFETLYFGSIPVVSDNVGVLRELREEGVEHLLITAVSVEFVSGARCAPELPYDPVFLFQTEMMKLQTELMKLIELP
ncbi:MAG: hypothetical protein FJ184_15865 [Gammaproteobacteria bacterium]|nr:hypothetical protein [Gammaproteobacteria bacterium]